MKRTVLAVIAAISLSLVAALPSNGAIKAGAVCKKAGLKSVESGRQYTCIKQGKKFVWSKGVLPKVAPAKAPAPVATPSTQPTPTPAPAQTYTKYQLTKLKALENIRLATEIDGSKNVKLNYRISSNVPQELTDLYTAQVIKASKLYGTFFKTPETVHVYVYTEKDVDFLRTAPYPRVNEILTDVNRWFVDWEKGSMQEHVLGGWAWYHEYAGKFEGHTGVFVYSKGTIASQRKYAIQVMPHEYLHVIQDYFIKRSPKWTSMNSYDVLFPPIFREGSANTISFALATESPKAYLDLYADFIREKKSQSDVPLFATLTSEAAVVSALKNIRTRNSSPDAHESSYSIGALVFEWLIAEYGFDAYRKLIENQQIGSSFADNLKASLGMTEEELYNGAAQHVLAAFTTG